MTGPPGYYPAYTPTVFAPRSISHYSPPTDLSHPIGSGPQYLSFLDNDGKVVSGKDRQGDEWTITVHGPGTVIVTDATPNDGVNDDDIDTILIQGSDPHSTYVSGQVTASARLITDGQVFFNHLVSTNGVQSIILNGFNLARTVVPPYGQVAGVGPEIYLPNGVKTLQFNNINATVDVAAQDQPYDIIIGTPTTPIRQKPDIKIGSVFNTVTNSALGFDPAGVPQTTPSVNFDVNGQINKLEMVSAGRAPNALAGYDVLFPTVSATGRTSVRALGINALKVYGSARNLTASRSGVAAQDQGGGATTPTLSPANAPFRTAFSGLDHLGSAEFGGPTDALGLDVDGPIGRLAFARGLGDPTGAMPGDTNLGFNEAKRSYGSFGFYGGLITSTGIGHLNAGPNNVILQTANDPDFIQLRRQGTTNYFVRPGNAMSFAAVTSQGSIGSTDIVGNLQSSEVKTGFDYASYLAGLEGTRAPSAIRNLRLRGDLVDSVISATYRPGVDGIYGATNNPADTTANNDTAGPGAIRGRQEGSVLYAGGQTALGYRGAGVFARYRSPGLQPPGHATRLHGVRVRS
jgi:hypothetical protein